MTTATIHPFERTGLGVAPFTCIAIRENARQNGDGTMRAAGSCDYCGTGIRYECVIRSHDGRTFVVGTDCVGKLARDDNRLASIGARVAEWKRERAREAATAQRIAEREAYLVEHADEIAAQDAERARIEAARIAAEAQHAAVNAWLADVLRDAGEWGASVADTLGRCALADALGDRGLRIARDIYGKAHGRRNSKAYEAACAEFDTRTAAAEVAP